MDTQTYIMQMLTAEHSRDLLAAARDSQLRKLARPAKPPRRVVWQGWRRIPRLRPAVTT